MKRNTERDERPTLNEWIVDEITNEILFEEEKLEKKKKSLIVKEAEKALRKIFKEIKKGKTDVTT